MLRKGKFVTAAWIYFGIFFLVAPFLPEWVCEENNLVEWLQVVLLALGLEYCRRLYHKESAFWCPKANEIWEAGMIFFFLLIMREISWGRALLHHADGTSYQYEEMGLYGALVHPCICVAVLTIVFFLYRSQFWNFLKLVKLPCFPLLQLFSFVVVQWLAEHKLLEFYAASDTLEELAELGGYAMMLYIFNDCVRKLDKRPINEV